MKKGFELSISTIVTIIIGIVLLGFGLVFLNNIISGAGNIKDELDAETDKQLSLLLESGEKVAVPFNSFTLKRGERQVVGLGILNIYNEERSFSFTVESSMTDAASWVRYDKNKISIASKEQFKTVMLFTVPKNATSNTYIFDVKVSEATNLQDFYSLKKVYITVP